MGILEGKVALVSGASRGVGAAIARVLAREGAHCRKKPDLAGRAARDIREADGRVAVVRKAIDASTSILDCDGGSASVFVPWWSGDAVMRRRAVARGVCGMENLG